MDNPVDNRIYNKDIIVVDDRSDSRHRSALGALLSDHGQVSEELQALQQRERDLERLRALVEPRYWPRIYEMLKHVRERMLQLEREGDGENSKSQNAA